VKDNILAQTKTRGLEHFGVDFGELVRGCDAFQLQNHQMILGLQMRLGFVMD
jgi:hypothetical protein